MRFIRLLAILGIAAAGHGCNLIYLGTDSVAGEAKLTLIHHQLLCQARQRAQDAWENLNAPTNWGVVLSKDYERGFKEGFVRTVWWGPEEAPVVPPSGYWSARYHTPDGQQAIADWAEGFRRGVSVALQSGAALSVKVPGPGLHPGASAAHTAQNSAPVPAPPANGGHEIVPDSGIEKLPMPRPLPPAAVPLSGNVGPDKGIELVGVNVGAIKTRDLIETAPALRAPVSGPAGSRNTPASAWTPVPSAMPAVDGVTDLPVGRDVETLPSSTPPVQLGRPR